MAKKPKEKLEQFAFTVTRLVGSIESIIVHSMIFLASFMAVWSGLIPFDRMLLVLTTIVSLEAIYLSIFIQMTINYQAEDIDEIQEDIDEIQEDVDEIQEDVDEIQEDVDEIQEDVEEMTEEEKADEVREAGQAQTLEQIHIGLKKLMGDIEKLQSKK
jgi:low affinity Fe/Cu permease